MTNGFYIPGNSLVHQCGAGIKLLALIGFCFAIFLVDRLQDVALIGSLVIALYAVAKIPIVIAYRQVKPAAILLVIIFIVQILLVDWQTAGLVVLRFAAIILAASLLTLTTRSSDMLAALEVGLTPLSIAGVNTNKISLALSLAIRFIPAIAAAAGEVREAQRARGLDHSLLAVAVPTIVRTLKMADDISDAIDARCYDSKNYRG